MTCSILTFTPLVRVWDPAAFIRGRPQEDATLCQVHAYSFGQVSFSHVTFNPCPAADCISVFVTAHERACILSIPSVERKDALPVVRNFGPGTASIVGLTRVWGEIIAAPILNPLRSAKKGQSKQTRGHSGACSIAT